MILNPTGIGEDAEHENEGGVPAPLSEAEAPVAVPLPLKLLGGLEASSASMAIPASSYAQHAQHQPWNDEFQWAQPFRAPGPLTDLPKLTLNRPKTLAPAEEPSSQAFLEGGVTTVMLRNIPSSCTRDQLLQVLTQRMKGAIDFLYMPTNFKRRTNVGYAFINFRAAEDCAQFVEQVHKSDPETLFPGMSGTPNGEPTIPLEVRKAHYQGSEENVRRLQSSQVMWELLDFLDWLPILIDPEGNPVDFPLPSVVQAALDARIRASEVNALKGTKGTKGRGSKGAKSGIAGKTGQGQSRQGYSHGSADRTDGSRWLPKAGKLTDSDREALRKSPPSGSVHL